MSRTNYEITSGGSGSFATYGFWLDERPALSKPTSDYEDLLVSIPHSNKQLDFSTASAGMSYPNGRDFEYTFRTVHVSDDEHDVVADVNTFYAWLVSLHNVTITDTWNNRTFNNCTVTEIEPEYPDNYGYEATVKVKIHSVNAADTDGVI